MSERLKVLESFKFRRVQYYTGGYIITSRFTEIELKTLSSMGKIELKQEPLPTLPPKKEKTLKGPTGASKSDKAEHKD